MNKILYFILSLLIITSVITFNSDKSFARKVVCIDSGSSPSSRGYLNNREGWEWQNHRPGDLIVLGGRLDSCLKRLNNGDTLIIITHSPDTVGGSFVWGGLKYNGFGTGTGKYPVPSGFDTLRNIHTKFSSCFSAKDPYGADTTLISKIIAAMGGSGRGHTAEGFTGYAVASNRMTLRPKAGARQRDVDSAARVIQHPQLSIRWKSCPPINRMPAPAANQRTCAQQLVDSLVGAGKVNVIISGYTMPRNRPQNSLIGPPDDDTCFICECYIETDSLCGCAPSDVTECEMCIIYGDNLLYANQTPELYEAFSVEGLWTLTNFPPCNASIVGTNSGDSIYIDPGAFAGTFSLCLSISDTCGDSICCLQVTVEKSLPVEMLSFISSVSGNDVTLKWKTGTEINNSGFQVERALYDDENSDDWINIGFVQGNGTVSKITEYEFMDKDLFSGRYKYRLKQIDYNGNFTFYLLDNEVSVGKPDKYYLSQNYPNPFNPSTKINFDIANDGNVKLILYDINGKEIAKLLNEFKSAGYYSVKFDAGFLNITGNLASGIYFYRIESGNFIQSKKMMYLK
ncbi:MAG: hypothetical protein HGGPFJEG_02097 [Ignavibacteria bacterium]|nr:hypothetical protein [Ignavibacteria bacterium]